MPESTSVIPQLTRWGVTADADLVYRALRLLGPRGKTALSQELGLSHGRVTAALEELAALDGARPGAGLEPAAGGSGRRPGHRCSWPGCDSRPPYRRARIACSATCTRSTVLTCPRCTPAASRHWPNRAVTRCRIARLVAAEQHEHLAVNTEEVFSSESWAAAMPLDRSLLDRGLRVRVLSRPPNDHDQGLPPARASTDAEGRFRQLADLPLKLIVFDRRIALVPADPLNFDAGFVEIAHPPAVQALCALFHRLWSRGRDPFRQGVRPIDLTPRERALVSLLAAGHTDVTAAAQLNLSVRTVAYTLRALMDRLGVENRFQLALLLGAAGAAPLPGTEEPSGGDR